MPDSDWDVCILTEAEVPFPQKQLLLREIRRALARLGIPNDIVIRSEDQFMALKDIPGVLSYDVAREGVTLYAT